MGLCDLKGLRKSPSDSWGEDHGCVYSVCSICDITGKSIPIGLVEGVSAGRLQEDDRFLDKI